MIAEGLLEAGATVVISSRKAAACNEAAAALGRAGECLSIPANLADDGDSERLVEDLRRRFDSLDILVNNAGASWGAPLDEYPPEAFDKVLGLNLKAVFTITQALLPMLRAAATPDSPARVINIGSVDGLVVPSSDNFAYSASKAGVHMLTRHLATRTAADHITVNAIAPGPFSTKMMAHLFEDEELLEEMTSQVPLGRTGEPRDIAALTTFLAGPGARWITGAVIPLDGGVSL
jgi:NAD(P)-dependent dehydrogenase (short-subunit alcohol dehydrogenase family)